MAILGSSLSPCGSCESFALPFLLCLFGVQQVELPTRHLPSWSTTGLNFTSSFVTRLRGTISQLYCTHFSDKFSQVQCLASLPISAENYVEDGPMLWLKTALYTVYTIYKNYTLGLSYLWGWHMLTWMCSDNEPVTGGPQNTSGHGRKSQVLIKSDVQPYPGGFWGDQEATNHLQRAKCGLWKAQIIYCGASTQHPTDLVLCRFLYPLWSLNRSPQLLRVHCIFFFKIYLYQIKLLLFAILVW